MGGNAFENTQRLDEAAYRNLCSKIRTLLEHLGCQVGIPVDIADKAELCLARGTDRPYGDVDVIVGLAEQQRMGYVADAVRKELGGREEPRINSNTISFLTAERYQVDLLFVEPENVEFLTAFKSNNDFGALLGHMLCSAEMKWCDKGLALRLKVAHVSGLGTHKSDFILSDDRLKICEFLGIDAVALDGKTRLASRQVFDILTGSRLFYPEKFNPAHKAKEMRKNRPLNNVFFRLLDEADHRQLVANKVKKYAEDDVILAMLESYNRGVAGFDELADFLSAYFGKNKELQEQLETVRNMGQNTAAVPKFSHGLIMQWHSQLTPGQAGRVLQRIKSRHSGSGRAAYDRWVEETSLDDIRREVDDEVLALL